MLVSRHFNFWPAGKMVLYLTICLARMIALIDCPKKWTKWGEKWKRIGRNSLHVPIIAGDAVNLYSIRTAGFYLYMIMSRYAWNVKKRKKNGRIMRTCPNRWSQPAWRPPTNLMEIRPVTASTIFALLSVRLEAGIWIGGPYEITGGTLIWKRQYGETA